MKKLFTLLCLMSYSFFNYGQTTYFEQDFVANSTLTSYVSATAPSNKQFTELVATAGFAYTITSGRLQIAKSGTTIANTQFSRASDFTVVPNSMYCQFNFGVSTAVAATKLNAVVLNFGGSTIIDGTSVPQNADVYAKLNIHLIAGGSTFQVNDGSTNSANFTGNQNITFVMNNTGASFTYVAPDGTNEILGNDLFDVWVGTTKVFNDRPVTTPAQTIKRFKFNIANDAAVANTPTFSFDNFLMRDVAGSLLVNSTVSTPDSMFVKYFGTGAIKRVGIGTTTPTTNVTIRTTATDTTTLRLEAKNAPTSYYTELTNLHNGAEPFYLKVGALKLLTLKSIGLGPTQGEQTSVLNGYYNLGLSTGSQEPSSSSVRLFITNTGNVGIGTTTPNNKLEVSGGAGKSGVRFTGLNAASTAVASTTGKVLSVDVNGDIILVKDSVGTAGGGGTTPWTQIANNRIQNSNSGAVVIGGLNTASLPGNYKLYVKDGILTEEVKIAAEGSLDWADYVFAKNYKLRSLSEVESFVKINKHLPGVPSAEEVSKNGINVAKMEAKLLEKIEELTLYMIELKNENKGLKNRLKKLESKK